MDIDMILISYINSNALDTTDGQIALTIFENLYSFNTINGSELAELCNVSTSAITRFCKKIGLEGFFELKYLISQYHIRMQQKFKLEGHNLLDMTPESYIDLQIKHLNSYKENFNHQAMSELVDLITTADKITILGNHQSIAAAIQMQATLFQIGIVSTVLLSPIEQQEFLTTAHPDDHLVIIFSISGVFFDRKSKISITPDNTFALITYNADPPRKKDYKLILSSNSPMDYTVDHIHFSLTNSLIAMALYQYYNRNSD